VKRTATAIDQRFAALKISINGILLTGAPHGGSDKTKRLATATNLACVLQKGQFIGLVGALKQRSLSLEVLRVFLKDILDSISQDLEGTIQCEQSSGYSQTVVTDSALIG